MSYLVLARKWRPLKFEDVIGQSHVVLTLQNAIKNDRLANAYLFSGPRGIGKTTIARILTKAINCENGPTTTPCNKCSYCEEITNGQSLDVFEIDGASNRGIDEVRSLRENLKYAPSPGKFKIYIIDEVHMLTDPAFNALLKTLEEPPTRVMFIFATTEPHKIPATILSRCQRFDFKRITMSEITNQLKQICKIENIKIDDDALNIIARKADGGMRDAQSLLDQAISFSGNNISGKKISELLGIIDFEIYFKITNIILEKDKTSGLLLTNDIVFNGFDLNEFLIGLNEHFRNILITKATNSIKHLDVVELYANKYLELSNNFTENDLLQLIKIASDTEFVLKKSSNPRLTLELALIKMIKMDSAKDLNEILSEMFELKNQLSNSNIDIVKENTPTYNTQSQKKKVSTLT